MGDQQSWFPHHQSFNFYRYKSFFTRGVLAQSHEPEAHDNVVNNNSDRIEIWKCWFFRRGENRSTRRKTSRSMDENQQQTQPRLGHIQLQTTEPIV